MSDTAKNAFFIGLIVGTFCDTTTALLMLSVNFLIENKPLPFMPENVTPREIIMKLSDGVIRKVVEHTNQTSSK
jgi:hypothetical protein